MKNEIKQLQERLENAEKLLKETLKNAERTGEMFHNAFTTSPDAVNINTLSDGLYVSVNQGFTQIMGYSPDEVIGKTSLELNIWKDKLERDLLVKMLLESGKVQNFETEFIRKDGSIITGLMSASVIEMNGIQYILNTTKDITERKKIERELEYEQFLINSLMDNLTDAVYFKDLESRFIRISKALLPKFGISDTSEAIGKSDFDFFSEEHAREAFKDEREILTTGKTIIKEERETHADAPDTWVSTAKMPLTSAEGKIVGSFGISRDITSRKRIESEKNIIYEIIQGTTTTSNLNEFFMLMHANLSKLVYAKNIYITLYDPLRKIFSFPYYVDEKDPVPEPSSLENSCTAYVFRTGSPLLLNDEMFQNLCENHHLQLIGSASPSWVGIPLKTPSGTIGALVLQHYETENVFSTKDVEFLNSVCSQIAIAITRKRDEEELFKKNEMLHKLNAEKDKFFSIIAHDLKGPLGSFVEATKLITESESPLSIAEINEFTAIMSSEANSLYTLLENLLQWAKFKRGAMDFVVSKFKVLDAITGSVDLLSEQAKHKGILIKLNIPVGLEIEADINMFKTIIRNLVSNAIKFTPNGGAVTISAILSEKDYIEISVMDNGIGMDEVLIKKLFLLSEKPNRPGTNGEPSSGLGLLLCKEFIEKHSGTINVNSEPGKGSSFNIYLPISATNTEVQ